MFTAENLIAFITTSTILAFAPGPDNIFVLTQSILGGRKAGMKITLGLCTGLIVHTLLVTIGVSAIFQTSLIAFNVLKYLGVLYLLFLAWKSFTAKKSSSNSETVPKLSSWKLYRRGIIMNITNPKVSLFFMAFLPQFTNPNQGSISLQLIVLGLIFIAITFVVFGLIISQLSGIIGQWINKSERGQSILNKVAGTIFVGLAAKLIFTNQK